MLALSVNQPWPYAMFYLGKDIENRDWATKIRGYIFVHAGKKYDESGHRWIEAMFKTAIPKKLPLGGMVGITRVVDCVKNSESEWFFGDYGFKLEDSQEIEFVPWKGKLGFFEVPYTDVCGKVHCQYCDNIALLYNVENGLRYWCQDCNAYVGCHKGTDMPMGTLANKELRRMRIAAHREFNKLYNDNLMSRSEAYQYMQKIMKLPKEKAHIAMFNEEQCQFLIDSLTSW